MGFIDSRKEYEICDMYPRRPWMNYLWNEEYIMHINQFGIGKALMKAEKEFWDLVESDTPPSLDGLDCTSEALQSIYKESRNIEITLYGRENLLKNPLSLHSSTRKNTRARHSDGLGLSSKIAPSGSRSARSRHHAPPPE